MDTYLRLEHVYPWLGELHLFCCIPPEYLDGRRGRAPCWSLRQAGDEQDESDERPVAQRRRPSVLATRCGAGETQLLLL